jgi:hypothetical protein
MQPDTYDRMQNLFAKFSSFPEIGHTPDGVIVRKDAFVAFLDARQLIEKEVLTDVYAATKGWQPIATYFKAEPETPNVLLFDGEVTLGYFDEDCQCWRQAGDCAEDEPLQPTKCMRLGEVCVQSG